MKRLSCAMLLAVVCATAAVAQKAKSSDNGGASDQTSVSQRDRQITLDSDTQVSAQLEGALDVRRVKPGDRVVMKTLQAIKRNGQTIVPKGARVVGRVTEVAQRTSSNAESRLGVALDRLEKGSMSIPITGSIISITQASTRANISNDDVFADSMMSSSSSAGATATSSSSSRSSSGGLLGGVGNTVGGVTSSAGNVAGSTTSAVGNTVGSTVNTTGNAVRTTSGTARNTVSGIQISPSAGASAEGGSTLSLNSRNLRLESGTTFSLLISGSSSRDSR